MMKTLIHYDDDDYEHYDLMMDGAVLKFGDLFIPPQCKSNTHSTLCLVELVQTN